MQLPTTHIHPSSSKNALMKIYKFIHYRSLQKVNKNTFWVKASYMNMEDPIEMKLKRLLRVHPKISKKPKNTLLGSKLREICMVKVGHFWKFAQRQHWSLLIFFPNGPMFSCLKIFPKRTHDPWTYPPIILLFLLFVLIFHSFKSK